MLISGNNPMIDCALERTFTDVGALLEWARANSESLQTVDAAVVPAC
jgi:hypothetical protein